MTRPLDSFSNDELEVELDRRRLVRAREKVIAMLERGHARLEKALQSKETLTIKDFETPRYNLFARDDGKDERDDD